MSIMEGSDNFMVKQPCDALMLSFKNNVVNSFYFLKDVDQALKNIDEELIDKIKDK